MGQFNSVVRKRIHAMQGMQDVQVWQRNYYDHLIRNRDDLELTWQHIVSNPARWPEDNENPP
jgi:putative transposase